MLSANVALLRLHDSTLRIRIAKVGKSEHIHETLLTVLWRRAKEQG